MSLPIENRNFRSQIYQSLQIELDKAVLENRQIGLLLVKLDGLINVEVNMGFELVEILSKKVYARLIPLVSEPKFVSQISLNTFLVIVPQALNHAHLNIVGLRVIKEIKKSMLVEHESVTLFASVGASLSSECPGGELLFSGALVALEQNLVSDQNVTIFTPELSRQLKKKWDLKKDINIALHENQFELYFQPKINLNTGEASGAEALIRWIHPSHGIISPDEFIPVSETTGQIQEISEWVIKSGIRQLSSFLENDPEFKLSVNVSANNLASSDLLTLIKDTLLIWNVPAKNLVVEVTETAIMSDATSSLHLLNSIREIGVGVSIDDFGTGYSSLAYFKNIPATEIKIDRSFVDQVNSNSQDETIVSLIVLLAKEFEFDLVAEGIETQQVLETISKLGCNYGQGYYFSKPLCFDEFNAWLGSYKGTN